jgi:hypothetical protein
VEICLICNTLLEIVTDQHCAKHDLTKEEYRSKYGRKIYNGISIRKRNIAEIDRYEAESRCKRRAH